jgi:hypothetical protein
VELFAPEEFHEQAVDRFELFASMLVPGLVDNYLARAGYGARKQTARYTPPAKTISLHRQNTSTAREGRSMTKPPPRLSCSQAQVQGSAL